MLVKFFSRGKGGGAAPVDYLLGKDRNREDASVLRGDAEQVKQLIDGLSFARNYTAGCLSFAEKDIPEHQKQELIDSFQDALMAGLDRNQYDVLWVEHKDKDRLELNFLIPNVELSTNKRLQPYYDKNDRHYVNAWQQVTNDSFKFKDPHDPANRRSVLTSKDLPKDKQKAALLITNSLVHEVENGAIRNRDDVIKKLKFYGFEIARETKSSISIKDPEGGKNLRLKGELYERNFKSSQDAAKEIERTIREYRENRSARLSQFKATFEKAYIAKRKANRKRYKRNDKERTATPNENNIQRNHSISDRHSNGLFISNGNTDHITRIEHHQLKQIAEQHERHSKAASASNQELRNEIADTTKRTSTTIERIAKAVERYAATIINACSIRRDKLEKRRERDQANSMKFGR